MGTLTVDNLNLKGSGSVSSVGTILQIVQTFPVASTYF